MDQDSIKRYELEIVGDRILDPTHCKYCDTILEYDTNQDFPDALVKASERFFGRSHEKFRYIYHEVGGTECTKKTFDLLNKRISTLEKLIGDRCRDEC